VPNSLILQGESWFKVPGDLMDQTAGPKSHVSEPRQAQDAAEHAVGVEMLAGKLPRGRCVSDIVAFHGFEALDRRIDIGVREQASADGKVLA